MPLAQPDLGGAGWLSPASTQAKDLSENLTQEEKRRILLK